MSIETVELVAQIIAGTLCLAAVTSLTMDILETIGVFVCGVFEIALDYFTPEGS